MLDADIRDFFGTLDHQVLIKRIERRVSDRRVLRLVRQWLRAKVMDERLKLELHPDKTRRVDLSWGKEGFDFLGCHLRKRLSGPIWEKQRKRVSFLQRWPSQRSMMRVRQRVKELTPKVRCHEDVREVIADLNPVLRGWGNYFRTGNAGDKFIRIDSYVWERLRALCASRGKGGTSGPVRPIAGPRIASLA